MKKIKNYVYILCVVALLSMISLTSCGGRDYDSIPGRSMRP